MADFDEIKNQLVEGDIGDALHELILLSQDSKYESECIIFRSRHISNEKNQRLKIIEQEYYDITKNTIISDTLNLISLLENEAKKQASKKQKDHSVQRVFLGESNPFPKLNLLSNVEFREIKTIFENNSKSFNYEFYFALDIHSFTNSIQHQGFEIIHLTAFSKEEGIYFHDSADQAILIKNNLLNNYISMIDQNVKCFFFNTFISEHLASEISKRNKFVIGFNQLINIQAAIEFAIGFYTALGYHKNYHSAFKIGYQNLISGQYKSEGIKLFAYFDNQKITHNTNV